MASDSWSSPQNLVPLILGGAGATLGAIGQGQQNKLTAQNQAAQLALQRGQMQLGATQLDPFAQQKQAQKQALAGALVAAYKPATVTHGNLSGGLGSLGAGSLNSLPEFSPAAQQAAAQSFAQTRNNAFGVAGVPGYAAPTMPGSANTGSGGSNLAATIGAGGSLAGTLMTKGIPSTLSTLTGGIGGGLGLVDAAVHGNPAGGALSGAQLGGVIGGPLGLGIGAGVGALVGLGKKMFGNVTRDDRNHTAQSLGYKDESALDQYLHTLGPEGIAAADFGGKVGRNNSQQEAQWRALVAAAIQHAQQQKQNPINPALGLGTYL